jgi:diacylglycerol O-acyltransferase / wax synthase
MEPLSGMDALFLYAETPEQPQHVTLTAVLDPASAPGGVTFDQVRAHIARRLHRVPPLTRRLVTMPLGLHHPHWVGDPEIDLDHHVRRVELAAPGDDHQLAAVVAQISAVPLDRTRPLWEMWIIEGLAGDRFALVAKLHHATLDGVAGVEQMIAFFDLEPLIESGPAPAGPDADPDPSTLELVTYAAVSRARSMLRAVPLAARTVGSVQAVRSARATPGVDAGGTPLVTPRTSLNDSLTAARRVAFARLPLDGIKTVKAAVPGATVNDVILAVCAGALRRYLSDRGELPDEPLVAACPVDVRTEDQRGRSDNRVSAMFTRLPTDVADPLGRLEAAHRAARAAKDEHALFDPDVLQQWADVLDPNLASWLIDLYSRTSTTRRHRPPVNLVVSNVAGPPFPLYLAGAELVRAFPLGQLIEGIGLNMTVMSYRDGIDVGFLAAGDLVPDVDRLAAAVPVAFAELLDAAI